MLKLHRERVLTADAPEVVRHELTAAYAAFADESVRKAA
jgi:hypothetical protein